MEEEACTALGRLVDDSSGVPLSNVHNCLPVCRSSATSLPSARLTSSARSALQEGQGCGGCGSGGVGCFRRRRRQYRSHTLFCRTCAQVEPTPREAAHHPAGPQLLQRTAGPLRVAAGPLPAPAVCPLGQICCRYEIAVTEREPRLACLYSILPAVQCLNGLRWRAFRAPTGVQSHLFMMV